MQANLLPNPAARLPKRTGKRLTQTEWAALATELGRLAGLGLTREQIANFKGIALNTLDYWGKRHREVRQALKTGRAQAGAQVLATLYRRAMGQPAEVVVNCTCPNCKEKFEKKVTAPTKPPEIAAVIFWLKAVLGLRDSDPARIEQHVGAESLRQLLLGKELRKRGQGKEQESQSTVMTQSQSMAIPDAAQ